MPFIDALTYRQQGNDAFKSGDIEKAVVKYRTALTLAQEAKDPSVEDTAVAEIVFVAHLNLALCHLKTKEWDQAEQHALQALELNAHHPKALYRAAVASLEQGKLDACATHLKDLLEVDRQDVDAHTLLARLHREVVRQKDQVKDVRHGDDINDSMRVVSEYGDNVDSFSDASALRVAFQVLNTWIVKTARSSVVAKNGFIKKAWSAVHRCFTELDVVHQADLLATIEAGVRLCQILVLEVTDQSEEARAEQEKQEALRLSTDIALQPDIKQARDELRAAVELQALHTFLRQLVSAGVSEIDPFKARGDKLMEAKVGRRNVLVACMDLLHYIGDLEDSLLLKCLSEGMNTVECRPVQLKALTSLTFLADRQRRKGLKVRALKLTHGLQCCLESLVSMLEDEGEFAVDAFSLGKSETTSLESPNTPGFRPYRHVEFALTSIFHLLADKERSDDDVVSWNTITEPLVAARLSSSKATESESFAAYQTLNILWLADRQEVFRFSLQCALPAVALHLAVTKTFQDPRLQSAAAEYLLNVMEFPEMRSLVIEGENVPKLIDLANTSREVSEVSFRCQLLAVLARLSVHTDFLREMIFDMVDFVAVTGDIIKLLDFDKVETFLKKNRKSLHTGGYRVMKSIENLMEILFFVSLHAAFKREIVGLPPVSEGVVAISSELPPLPDDATKEQQREREEEEKRLRLAYYEKEDERLAKLSCGDTPYLKTISRLGKFVCEYGSAEASFLFAGLVHNLTRGEGDKDRLKKTKNSPDFDEAQMLQLQYIYEKLPAKAKPQDAAQYYRGGPNLTHKLRKAILAQGSIIPALKVICTRRDPVPTSNLLKLCSIPVHHLCQHQELRPELFKQGGFHIMRKSIEGFKDLPDEIRDFRQTIAHFAMSINPINFSYPEIMGMTSDLLVLLEDSYELFAYEAALGLTNLMASNEDVRQRVWHASKGYKALREIAISENDLLRAAGIEMICNLFVSDRVKGEFYQEYLASQAFDFDVAIMLSFLKEVENTRAWQAAAGALSIMSQDCRLALCLAKHEKFTNAITSIETAIKTGLEAIQIRLIVFLTNVWKSVQWLITQADRKEFEGLPPHQQDKILLKAEDMAKQLFVFFGMLDAVLKPAQRELLKSEATLYPKCPVLPFLANPDTLPPAVVNFWSQISLSNDPLVS